MEGRIFPVLLLVEKNPMIQPDLAFEKTKANLKNVKDILDDTVRIQHGAKSVPEMSTQC